MKIKHEASFVDIVCDLRVRKIKSSFFHQMDLLIDWGNVSNIIGKYYTKGESAVGTASYDRLLLFKMYNPPPKFASGH